MDERRIWFEPNLFARLELVTFTKHGDDFLTSEFCKHLRLRTSRLYHDDFGFGAVFRDGKVLRTNAIDSRTSVGTKRRRRERQFYALRAYEAGIAVGFHFVL